MSTIFLIQLKFGEACAIKYTRKLQIYENQSRKEFCETGGQGANLFFERMSLFPGVITLSRSNLRGSL